MQRAISFAHRALALSALRSPPFRYQLQLHQRQSASAVLRPQLCTRHSQLRSFHASSPAFAKHLNFNLADIGEGIAEVRAHARAHRPVATSPVSLISRGPLLTLRVRLSCCSGLCQKGRRLRRLTAFVRCRATKPPWRSQAATTARCARLQQLSVSARS